MFSVLWVQEKEPRYAFSFSLEVPVREPPPGSPIGPYGESCPFTGPFLHISNSSKNFPK